MRLAPSLLASLFSAGHPMTRAAMRQAQQEAVLRSLTDTERRHLVGFMRSRGLTFEAAYGEVMGGARLPVAELEGRTPTPPPEREWAAEPSRHVQGPRRLSRAKRKQRRAKQKGRQG